MFLDKLNYLGEYSMTLYYLVHRATEFHLLIKGRNISRILKKLCLFFILDFSLGYFLYSWLLPRFWISDRAFWGIFNLKEVIRKLMNAPAGLKLNRVFSKALGRFFLYHIHLWEVFIFRFSPIISVVFENGLHLIIFCGLGFQICMVLDIFNIVTFHVRCFHIYARRLLISQSCAIKSLWRLFLGKKYNPLRNRVDSCAHNIDQLFVGTLAFTIALFLYPTTLTYFVVFKTLERAVLAVNVTLEIAIQVLQITYWLQLEVT
ncbi:phosphatidylinositol N-acetylglucosaminyltransferase subunit Q [Lepeophtheirus salmonis]|uniref:phosphatidylinositol N-acetylglucosaminyltransferase subunit Q n=1 Tax=Lepeophtheirus salmonis TaxID=72036 RepID=UPI001AEA50BC|nr:phosphatidylinositol N-acetylglucosaminyltransferase subunit Q-like isoform X1 [Lepeophtheirus salmonis]